MKETYLYYTYSDKLDSHVKKKNNKKRSKQKELKLSFYLLTVFVP